MTYALALPLQQAIYTTLTSNGPLAVLVEGRVYDAPPHGSTGPDPTLDYVTLGEERVRADGSKDCLGAVHDFTVEVHSGHDGFSKAKAIAGSVCDALIDAPLPLSRGTLAGLRFLGAQALRARRPNRRRIVLRFRAVVEDG